MIITFTSLHLFLLISIISLVLSYFIFRKWTRNQVGKSADFAYLRNCSSRMYERLTNAEKVEAIQTKTVNILQNQISDLKKQIDVAPEVMCNLQNQIAVLRDHVQVKLGQKIDEYASNNAKYYGDIIHRKDEEIEGLKTKLNPVKLDYIVELAVESYNKKFFKGANKTQPVISIMDEWSQEKTDYMKDYFKNHVVEWKPIEPQKDNTFPGGAG